MKDIASERSSRERLPSIFTVIDQGGRSPRQDGLLLEVRTEDGSVYVRPSRWQRMRLRRAFRYFHVVPPELLSRGQQRLIAKLLRTAAVTPEGTVAGTAVFGVVQKVHSQSLVEAPAPATLGPVRAPGIKILPRPQTQKQAGNLPALPPAFVARDTGLWPWIVSGAAAAAFIPLIMASVYFISLVSSKPAMSDARGGAASIQQVAKHRTPQQFQTVASGRAAAVPARISLTRKHRAAADESLAANQNAEKSPIETAALPQRRFVSELPPGHFAHPVVGTHNLVGEVRLKALIGADGSVKHVTVLSGNPRLAQAAMRAVLRWRYSPYEVQGNPVTVETEVKMSFFGPDAVSIASVADTPASQLK